MAPRRKTQQPRSKGKKASKVTAKKKTTKAAAARKTETSQRSKRSTTTTKKARQTAKVSVSPEKRHRMIAERAYLRAEKRGFQGGDPVIDWVEAEREVDQASSSTAL